MIDYGKIAYNKVNDVVRNKLERFNFCFKTINKQITNTKPNFKFWVNAKNKIYFKVDLSNKATLKVFVNGVCEYIHTNLTSSNFELFINGNSQVEFCFYDFEIDTNCSLQVLGEFDFTDLNNLNLIPFSDNLLAIKTEEDSFKVFSGSDANNVINKVNLNDGTIFNYNYLSVCSSFNNTFCLTELNGNNYIIKNFSEVIMLTEKYSANAKVVKCQARNSVFFIVDVVNDNFTISLYSESANLIAKYVGLKVGKLSNIVSVKEVYNNADTTTYFIVQDANKFNYVVLCNFAESFELKPQFNAMLIGKDSIISCEKTASSTFEICFKLLNGIKFETVEIDFNNLVLATKVVSKLSSAKSGLKFNGLMILNFSGVLEIY